MIHPISGFTIQVKTNRAEQGRPKRWNTFRRLSQVQQPLHQTVQGFMGFFACVWLPGISWSVKETASSIRSTGEARDQGFPKIDTAPSLPKQGSSYSLSSLFKGSIGLSVPRRPLYISLNLSFRMYSTWSDFLNLEIREILNVFSFQ